nr:LOW QUALITY PROTEIN: protein CDV3 homolog [Equus asinus]
MDKVAHLADAGYKLLSKSTVAGASGLRDPLPLRLQGGRDPAPRGRRRPPQRARPLQTAPLPAPPPASTPSSEPRGPCPPPAPPRRPEEAAAVAETEERSLDNFFTKRDKKKERSSPAAPGEQRSREARRAAGAVGCGASTKAVTKEEDEWKEFEQKEVDYSRLRVQAMPICEKEEEDNEKREGPGDKWEGGGGGGVEKSSGPCNKTAPGQAPLAPGTVTETPEPATTSDVYRHPGARLTTTREKTQGPPEIDSDTQFPSLQPTAKHVGSWKDKEMEKSSEVVRHGMRRRDELSKSQALKLQLDNRCAVLEGQRSGRAQSS